MLKRWLNGASSATGLASLLTLCAVVPAHADVHLPAIESDNMLIQSGSAQLFGRADAGEKIKITYGDRKISTTADSGGQWKAALTKLKAGESFDIVLAGKSTVTIKNVLVGQVWLCSGQSNMEFTLAKCTDHDHEIAAAKHDQIRLFHVKRRLGLEPLNDVEGSWQVCDPSTAGPFSAVGYFFGRDLNEDLKEPVGLIESSWGGTPAQAWTSIDGLEADVLTKGRYFPLATAQLTYLKALLQAYEKSVADWKAQEVSNSTVGQPATGADAAAAQGAGAGQSKSPDKVKESDKDKDSDQSKDSDRGTHSDHSKQFDELLKARSYVEPTKPKELSSSQTPTVLFNGMVAPLSPFTIGGVIWYQGEANATTPNETMAYRSLFPALIKDWRKHFNNPDLPFLYVQLANFSKREKPNERSPWAELREAQLLTLRVPHTGMAVAIDVGEGKDIHPKNKQDVGKRLERIALAEVYGKSVAYSGPIFDHLNIDGAKAICSFKHTDQGLKTRDKDDDKVLGFVIAGADNQFVPADAVISGDTVIVSSPTVSQPVAVRYAWGGDPINNLYNGAGFPASPFRSDVPAEPAVATMAK